MRYILSILFVTLCIISFGRTITVGKGKMYASISLAIKNAKDQDSIIVMQGTYREGNIVIDRSIKLIGINFPVLDGQKKYEVITVTANNVLVQGFKIIRSGNSSLQDIAAIKITESQNVIIRNNILDDNFFGIYSQFGVKCIIENNKIKSYGVGELQSGNGIHCWKSDSLTIRNNIISGHRDGIYFEFVTNSYISGNISQSNIRYGLHFMFSNNDSYVSNQFVKNGAGVAVMFSKGVHMYRNKFADHNGDASYGVLLKEISDSRIIGNIFSNNTTGVFMEGTSRIVTERNIFRSNGWALKIQASCMEISVCKNNFLGNSFDVGTNGSLVLNTFDYNYWDKYEGYDINRNRIGDIPYRPVSMYSMIVEKNPPAMLLFRSFITTLLDKTEKIIPGLTPEALKDNHPLMKPLSI